MTQNDILMLAKAGFTAQQIAALNQVNASPVMTQTTPATQGAQQLSPAQPLDAMSQQIAALTQAVQANGILQTQQPKAQTADDVLAEIINPPSVLAAQTKGGGTV